MSPKEEVSYLLEKAADIAASENRMLARVLSTLRLALLRNELDLLMDRKKSDPAGLRSSLPGVCEPYLTRTGNHVRVLHGMQRIDLLRLLDQKSNEDLLDFMGAHSKEIESVIGTPPKTSDWLSNVKVECSRVKGRVGDRARAALCGWGIPRETARDWVLPIYRAGA